MRIFSYFILCLSLCGCVSLSKAPSKPKPEVYVDKERIAVLGLKNKAGVNQGELNYLSEVIRGVASKLPKMRYSVMTEDNILVMLPPETKLEDCQDSCAVTTGRNLGAHWVLVGSVVRFGSALRVTVRLHHSKSGELRGSERVKGSTLEELEAPLEKAAFRLFSELNPNWVMTQRGDSRPSTKAESFADKMMKLQKTGDSTTSSESANSDYEVKLRRLQRIAKEKEQLEKQMRAEHEQKVEQAWDEAEPIIERGNQVAKRALDAFLNEFKDSPFGSERAQEAQDLFSKSSAEYEETMQEKHVEEVELEWDKLQSIINVRGETAQQAIELFIQRYASHPRGNPMLSEAKKTLSSLNQRDQTEVTAPDLNRSGPSVQTTELLRRELESRMSRQSKDVEQKMIRLIKNTPDTNRKKPLYLDRLASFYWKLASDAQNNGDLKKAGDIRQKAIGVYKYIVRSFPDFEEIDRILFALGFNFQQKQQNEEAKTIYTELIRSFPESRMLSDALFNLAEIYFASGDVPGASQRYNHVINNYTKSPVYPYAVYKLGWCFYNTTDYQGALNQFIKVIDLQNALSAKQPKKNRSSLKKAAQEDIVRVYVNIERATVSGAFKLLRRYAPNRRNKLVHSLAELYKFTGQKSKYNAVVSKISKQED